MRVESAGVPEAPRYCARKGRTVSVTDEQRGSSFTQSSEHRPCGATGVDFSQALAGADKSAEKYPCHPEGRVLCGLKDLCTCRQQLRHRLNA